MAGPVPAIHVFAVQPNKITGIFGRRISKHYRGKPANRDRRHEPANRVIRSHYGNGFIKQYVRDHLILRTEAASNNVNDYGVKKRRTRSSIDGDPPFSIHLSLCSTHFHRFLALTERSDFCIRIGISSLPPSSLPVADPCKSTRVRTLMYCRSQPQYRSDLGSDFRRCVPWHARRSARPVQGFPCDRCCGLPPASSPRGLAAQGFGVSRRRSLQAVAFSRGGYQLAPQRISTSYPGIAHAWRGQSRAFGAPRAAPGLTAGATEQIGQPCGQWTLAMLSSIEGSPSAASRPVECWPSCLRTCATCKPTPRLLRIACNGKARGSA